MAIFRHRGQSLVEILVAVSIGIVIFLATAPFIAPLLKTSTQVTTVTIATSLASQLGNNIRVWADANWHNVLALATSSGNLYHLVAISSPFIAASGIESINVGTSTFTRFFYLQDIYRDSNGAIAGAIAGNAYDPSTKQVTIGYTGPGLKATSTMNFYITRHQSTALFQNNWMAGAGQIGPSSISSQGFATSSPSIATTTQGWLTLTPGSGSAISGTVQSTIFDTVVTGGVQLNTIIWQGNQPSGTSVKFQFAVSNNPNGPWTFIGPDGTGNSYYTPPAQVAMPLGYTLFNNFRYFRYAVTLVSANSGSPAPTISSITINLSP
jgi:hypothetical protein